MRISVTIPAYNASRHIEQTLDSIMAQRRQPDEVIVCDDGSCDDTASIAARHPIGAKVIRRENAGVSAARNDTIEMATGDLIANMDADDLWHVDYLWRVEEAFEQYPDARLVFTRYWPFLEGHRPPSQDEADDAADTEIKEFDLAGYLSFDRKGLPVLPSFSVMKRDDLQTFGARPYLETHRCGENLLVHPLLAAMGRSCCIMARLGRYRMHAQSITADEVQSARWMAKVVGDMMVRAEAMGFDEESVSELSRYSASWLNMAGRRLGGAGFRREARRSFSRGWKLGGGLTSLKYLLASYIKAMDSRLWCEAWRPLESSRSSNPLLGMDDLVQAR